MALNYLSGGKGIPPATSLPFRPASTRRTHRVLLSPLQGSVSLFDSLTLFSLLKKQLHYYAAAHSGGKGIEPLPKVLETPIIPVDQPPIIKTRFASLQIEIFIFCSFKTSYTSISSFQDFRILHTIPFFGKAHDLLVLLSLTCYHAYTQSLSTS